VKSPNYFLQFSAKQRYYLYEAYTFNFLTCSFDNVYIKKLPLGYYLYNSYQEGAL